MSHLIHKHGQKFVKANRVSQQVLIGFAFSMGLHPVYKTLLIALVGHSTRNISIIFSKRRTCRCGAGISFLLANTFQCRRKCLCVQSKAKKIIYKCFFVSLSQHNLRYSSLHENLFHDLYFITWIFCPVPPIHLLPLLAPSRKCQWSCSSFPCPAAQWNCNVSTCRTWLKRLNTWLPGDSK